MTPVEQLVADFMPQTNDNALTQVKKLAAVAIAAEQDPQVAEGFLQNVIRHGIEYELQNAPERTPLSQYGRPWEQVRFDSQLLEEQRQFDYDFAQRRDEFLSELGLKQKSVEIEEGKLSALNRSLDLEAQAQKFQQKQEKKKSFWGTLGSIVGFGASLLGGVFGL